MNNLMTNERNVLCLVYAEKKFNMLLTVIPFLGMYNASFNQIQSSTTKQIFYLQSSKN